MILTRWGWKPAPVPPVELEVRAHQLLPRDVIVQDGFFPLTVLNTEKQPCEMLSVAYDSAAASGWRAFPMNQQLTILRPAIEGAH